MKLAYLDCPTGIAGDMCLGALVDSGVPLEYLQTQLQSLGLNSEYHLRAEALEHGGQQGTKVYVDLQYYENHSHRHLPQIQHLLSHASLPPRVKDWSLTVFEKLAIAEGEVHGVSPNQVHFHEVGATDAIVDIVGTCIGLDWWGIAQLYCSALPTGGGTVKAAHGKIPVPVPAVLKLWETRAVPVYSNGINRELVTPTGAAIATTLVSQFGAPPAMNLEKVGWGAGTIELPIPNFLRLWIGTAAAKQTEETVILLETQIDDCTPQIIAYTQQQLLQAGALDVFTQTIGMKKSRVGILLSVVCHGEKTEELERIIFRETTTLGIRRTIQSRAVLKREIQTLQLEEGTVRIKLAYNGRGQIINLQPEYDDCIAIATRCQKSLSAVQQMAIQAWHLNSNVSSKV